MHPPGQLLPLMSQPIMPITLKLSFIALRDARSTAALLQDSTLSCLMSLFDVHTAGRLHSRSDKMDESQRGKMHTTHAAVYPPTGPRSTVILTMHASQCHLVEFGLYCSTSVAATGKVNAGQLMSRRSEGNVARESGRVPIAVSCGVL